MISEIIVRFYSILNEFLLKCDEYEEAVQKKLPPLPNDKKSKAYEKATLKRAKKLEKIAGRKVTQTLQNDLINWYGQLSNEEKESCSSLFFSSKSDRFFDIIKRHQAEIFRGANRLRPTRRQRLFKPLYQKVNLLYSEFQTRRRKIERLSMSQNATDAAELSFITSPMPLPFKKPISQRLIQKLMHGSSFQAHATASPSVPGTLISRRFFLSCLDLIEEKNWPHLQARLNKYAEEASQLHLHGKEGRGLLSYLHGAALPPSISEMFYTACPSLFAQQFHLIFKKIDDQIDRLSLRSQQSLAKFRLKLQQLIAQNKSPSVLNAKCDNYSNAQTRYLLLCSYKRLLEETFQGDFNQKLPITIRGDDETLIPIGTRLSIFQPFLRQFDLLLNYCKNQYESLRLEATPLASFISPEPTPHHHSSLIKGATPLSRRSRPSSRSGSMRSPAFSPISARGLESHTGTLAAGSNPFFSITQALTDTLAALEQEVRGETAQALQKSSHAAKTRASFHSGTGVFRGASGSAGRAASSQRSGTEPGIRGRLLPRRLFSPTPPTTARTNLFDDADSARASPSDSLLSDRAYGGGLDRA